MTEYATPSGTWTPNDDGSWGFRRAPGGGGPGAEGPAGPPGAQGPEGPEGPQGIQGPAGQDGSGVTVKGTIAGVGPPGFSGTSSGDMWLDTNGDGWVWDGSTWSNVGPVRGPEGPTGPEGPQGLKGDTGDTGPQGPAGADGAQGPQGPEGPTAVSIDLGNQARLGTDSLLYVPDNPLGEREMVANAIIPYDLLDETSLATVLADFVSGTDTADILWYIDPVRPAQADDLFVFGATRDYLEYAPGHVQDPEEPDTLGNGTVVPDDWRHVASQEWFVSRAGDTMYGDLETPTLIAESVESEFGVFAQGNIGIGQAESLEAEGTIRARQSVTVDTAEGETEAKVNLGGDYQVRRLIQTDGKRALWINTIASDLAGEGLYTIGPGSSSVWDASIRLRAEKVQIERDGQTSDLWQSFASGSISFSTGGTAVSAGTALNFLFHHNLGWAPSFITMLTHSGSGSHAPITCRTYSSGDSAKTVGVLLYVTTGTIAAGQTVTLRWFASGPGSAQGVTSYLAGTGTAGGTTRPPGSDGGGSLTTYTQTFPATWWRVYRSDNTLRTDSHSHIYQGRYSSVWGNMRSLVGYNVSVPAGAKAVSGYMTIDWEHWYYNGGGTAYFRPHDHTSAPSTFSIQSNTAWTYKFSTANPGAINIALPSNIVTQLLSGYTKGIALGPAPSDAVGYYGYAKPTPSITLRYQA